MRGNIEVFEKLFSVSSLRRNYDGLVSAIQNKIPHQSIFKILSPHALILFLCIYHNVCRNDC